MPLLVSNQPPWTLTKDEDPEGREHDALRALALSMRHRSPSEWPDLLLMLGDQVYADEIPPDTARVIARAATPRRPAGRAGRRFRGVLPPVPGRVVEPAVRWLLSTVPTAMIFDDHDVHDDWNTSRDWVRPMRARAGGTNASSGPSCPTGAISTSATSRPRIATCDEVFRAVREAEGRRRGRSCATSRSAPTARSTGARWSFKRDIGRTRIVVVDSRAGRVLEPGSRSMVDAERVGLHRGVDARRLRPPADRHLAAGLPRPRDAPPRGLERGGLRRRLGQDGLAAGEKLRQGLDLEHWAAFGDSLRALEHLLDEVARAGAGARPARSCCSPATSTTPTWPPRASRTGRRARAGLPGGLLAVPQPADSRERRAISFGDVAPGRALGRALARAAGVARRAADLGDRPRAVVRQPGRHAATSTDGARLAHRQGEGAGDEEPRLVQVGERRLA